MKLNASQVATEFYVARSNVKLEGITDDLVAYYELVVKRLDEDGFESFFGTSSGNLAFPELEWFADQAWNAAIHASKVRLLFLKEKPVVDLEC